MTTTLFLIIIFMVLFGAIIGAAALRRQRKILVMTVDSRELHEDLNTASYVSMTAVLNYNYARRHDYEYRFFHPFIDVNKIETKYRLTAPKNGTTSRHHSSGPGAATTAFHPVLQRFRGASWSKLPVLWHVASTHQQFEWILYIDSDVAVTANHGNRTIQEAISFWLENQVIIWGEKNLSRASIIFMPDDQSSAFGSSEPGDGVFLFRPNMMTSKMFKEWWDYDNPEYSFAPPYEQASLRKILSSSSGSGSTSFAMNKAVTSMVAEPQYPTNGMSIDDWCLKSGWICHIGNHWAKDRHRICRRMIHTEFKEDVVNTVFHPPKRRQLQMQSSAAVETVPGDKTLSNSGGITSAKSSSAAAAAKASSMASSSGTTGDGTGRPVAVSYKTAARSGVNKGGGIIIGGSGGTPPHYPPHMIQQFRTAIQHIKKNVVQFDVLAAAEEMAGLGTSLNKGLVSSSQTNKGLNSAPILTTNSSSSL